MQDNGFIQDIFIDFIDILRHFPIYGYPCTFICIIGFC